MRAVLAFVAVALAVGPAQADSALRKVEAEQQVLFEQIASSVVFIATEKGFGSGFFVDGDGLALTNAHVVGDKEQVKVVLHDGRKLCGQVIERGKSDTDIALVKIPATNTPPLKLAAGGDLRVGMWAASVGHGMGGIWAFTTGMVSNIYPLGRERPVFQTQIPLNPGNSGGPVIDSAGQVIGVVTAGIESANALNFAIRIDTACAALVGLAGACHLLTIAAPAGLAVFVDGKMVGIGPRVAAQVAPGTHEAFVVVAGKLHKVRISFPQQSAVDLTQ